jgi:NAD+ kinase
MPNAFNSIGLIGKYGDPGVSETVKAAAKHLLDRGVEVLLDKATAEMVPDHGLPTTGRQNLAERCDLAIVVGGDGTFLNAARSLADIDVPLLGVNLGRLGFLVDVSPGEMETLFDQVLAGEYTEEHRLLLRAQVVRKDEPIAESDALNDVVLHKWEVGRMIELQMRIDGRFVNDQRSDGLIVATPTGSTAYALSGGGPIIHPALDVLVLVPICPHTLTNRPLVVASDADIEMIVVGGEHSRAQLTCDGQINLGLVAGDRVRIRRKERKIRLIHPANYDYYEILRAKLHWGKSALK